MSAVTFYCRHEVSLDAPCSQCTADYEMPTLPTCQPASLSDVQIAELEWKVVEAAVELRKTQTPLKRIAAHELAWNRFKDATDALIAAREQVEKQ